VDQEYGIQEGGRPQAPEGNALSRLWWTIVSPGRLYDDLERAPIWWQPWIFVSVIGLLGLYIATPVRLAVVKLNQGGMSPEQLQKTIEMMEKYSFTGYLFVPIVVLIQALIVSAIGYVVFSVIMAQGEFRKYFTLYLYSNIILAIGEVVSLILVRLKGVDAIQSVSDATVSFGLDFLVPEGHKFIEAAVGSLNVFSIWSFAIIAMGLMRLFRATLNQAILAVVPLWLVSMVFGLITAVMSKTA
jgi:hypothetical protein